MSCNISGLKKEKCYGCYACYNICPLNAIDMLEDEEGFEYPKVNEEKCINCKRCLRACPSINPPHVNSDTAAYACYAKNQEEHMSSSSGGIFAIIARKILKNKGMVFGAAFDNQMQLGHISIEDNNELYKVKGTKYIQSSIGTTFVKVKENLKKGRMILFSGTPCQIAGLKAFLNEDYDNLLCVDLICHGVPSPGVWKRYLKEQFVSNKVISMQFRNKTRGINDVTLDYTLTNGSVFRERYKESSYIQGFINNYYVRPSCFECKFKGIDRCSDITIGDFWSLKEFHPEMLNQYGVSSVIIHSKKGERWFKDCLDQLVYCVAKTEEIAIWNESLINRIDKDYYRNQFYEMWNNKKIEEIVYELNQSKIKTRNKQNKAIACIKRIVRRIKNG